VRADPGDRPTRFLLAPAGRPSSYGSTGEEAEVRPRAILVAGTLLVVGTVTALPVQASSTAAALEPRSLARAQTIRTQIDARYRVLLSRGLAVTEAASTASSSRSRS
jgi:hypothetical protein